MILHGSANGIVVPASTSTTFDLGAWAEPFTGSPTIITSITSDTLNATVNPPLIFGLPDIANRKFMITNPGAERTIGFTWIPIGKVM